MSDYVAVRQHPTRFIVVLGHEDDTLERGVATRETYLVVEKPLAP
jgi:hypothetical protein